jgi:SAM-dependent methyltransferase
MKTEKKTETKTEMKIDWNSNADFYNHMAMMELEYTYPQIACLDIQPSDTVLDVGCGPGRISVLAARFAKQVTSLDAAPKMLAYVKENAARLNITNIQTVLKDWFDVKPGIDIEKHDIVVASRTEAMQDIDGISALANKYAAVILWANAPSIPDLVNTIYKGAADILGPPAPTPPGSAQTPPSAPLRGRANGYNMFFNKIYDLGYNPSVKVMTDGFTKVFPNEDETLAFFLKLKPDVKAGKEELLRSNLAPYLMREPDGQVRFRIETRTCVIWWKPEKDEAANAAAPDHYAEAHRRFYGEQPKHE